MGQDYLGEFEHMVLLSIVRLDDDAYGLAIKDELEAVAGRSPSSETACRQLQWSADASPPGR